MHPLLVRQVLYPLHERLKGRRTYECLARLERTQWLSAERLRELQWTRLQEHLEDAYRHVPYYRRLLDERGLAPSQIQSPADFRRVPFLTRDVLRANFEDLRARADLRRVQPMSTGGSTGVQATVLVDSIRMAFNEAVRWRAHRWFGLEPGAREVVLMGSPIEVTRQTRVRSLRDRLLNSRLLSAFDMGESQLTAYGRFIERFGPEKIYGYAGALHLLARYMERTGIQGPRTLKAVFTSAERLFDFQREAIRRAFGSPVANEYGSRDAGLVANECPSGRLHVAAEGILLEVEGSDGEGLGEIVVTNLYSPAMPIIRYRTGDLGELDPTPCPCGRTLPSLKRLEGRRSDFLVTTAGRVVHAQSVVHVMRTMPSIRESRVVQETLDRLVITVVPEPTFSERDRARLVAKTRALLGEDVQIFVETVSTIPPSPSGKFRPVVSHVADAFLDQLVRGARVSCAVPTGREA